MSTSDQIKKFIEDELLDDSDVAIESGTSLFRDQLLDSLNLLSLIAFLEKNFSIKIAPSEVSIDNMDSIDSMSAFVEKKQSQ